MRRGTGQRKVAVLGTQTTHLALVVISVLLAPIRGDLQRVVVALRREAALSDVGGGIIAHGNSVDMPVVLREARGARFSKVYVHRSGVDVAVPVGRCDERCCPCAA